MSRRRLGIGALALLLALGTVAAALAATPAERFRQAGDRARAGDYPQALAAYDSLARTGHATAALYWNWAQVADARGALGEALWAVLRARELAPADRAIAREIDRLREGANLDRAELAPDPLAAVARAARAARLDLVACVLLVLSLVAHVLWRSRRGPRAFATAAWSTLALGVCAAVIAFAGSLARPSGVVVRRGAPMLDAASPTAESVGTLREGEVVPILERGGAYVRVEDSSGVRGWALAEDVRSLTPLGS
jgi:hypothetical protein